MRVGRHRIYRNIGKREELFGLEIIDALLLLLFFGIFSLFSIPLTARLTGFIGTYVALRVFKRGKPERYLTSIVEFLRSPKRYSALGRDRGIHPYPFGEMKDGINQDQGKKNQAG